MSTIAAERPIHLVRLDTANAHRLQLTAIRRRMKAGTLRISDVMLDPPPTMLHLPLWKVISDTRSYGPIMMEMLNRHAIADGVNLAISLGRASQYTRRWVASFDDNRPKAVGPYGGLVPIEQFRTAYARQLAQGVRHDEIAERGQANPGTLRVWLGRPRGVTRHTARTLCRCLRLDPAETGCE